MSGYSASVAVIVDTVSAAGKMLYDGAEFKPFKTNPDRLYLPMRKNIATLMEQGIDYRDCELR